MSLIFKETFHDLIFFSSYLLENFIMANNYVQHKRPTRRLSEVRSPRSMSLNATEPLHTNHYPCSFSKDILLYQHDVVIEAFKSDTWHQIKGRSRCSEIIQHFIHQHQLDPEVFVWYDEQRCLYSTKELTTPQLKYSEDNQYRLEIKSSTKAWSTKDIYDYIDRKTDKYPHDVIRILGILLKRSIQDQVKIVKRTCYFVDESPKELGNAFEMRTGFMQSLNLSSTQLTLNFQTKETIFYRPMALLDFINCQKFQSKNPVYKYQRLNKILSGCLMTAQQETEEPMTYEFVQFDQRKPRDIYNESGESLTECYGKKRINLIEEQYSCIKVYVQSDPNKPRYLPVQICQIKEWQIYDEQVSYLFFKNDTNSFVRFTLIVN